MNRIALLGLVAIACRDGGDNRPAVTIPADHAERVNAAVPEAWRDRLRFEIGVLEDNNPRMRFRYVLARPAGWKPTASFGEYVPADQPVSSDSVVFGGDTHIRVGASCAGVCESKDWAAVVDKSIFHELTSGKTEGKVLADDRHAGGRSMIFEEADGDTHVVATWWGADAVIHHACVVELPRAAAALAPAFRMACSLVAVE